MASLKNRYANALLEISEESGTLEKDLEQVVFLKKTLDSIDVQTFLMHPHISDSEKYELFQKAFSDTISNNLMGFLFLMVRKSRESLIVPALTEYIEVANKKSGKIEAKVVSAKPLTEEQIESIAKILSRQTDMEINLKAKVDPDVIGGFYVLVDGHIYDGTVRNRLNNMRESLKRGSYEWK